MNAAAPAAGATGTATIIGNGINYNGGPLILNTTNVYYIWYGNWSGNNASSILQPLASSIGGSPYFNINTTYYDLNSTHVTNAVHFAGSTTDNYSQGASLTDSGVLAVVSSAISSGRLPKDTNGIYFVLGSPDVTETSGFCSQYCGWHANATISGSDIKFAFIGNAATQCPGSCMAQSTSPNGNPGADGMASVIAHELEEAVTDPDGNAWFDSVGNENADKCAWKFGSTYATSNGSQANVSLGGMNYLIQQNWVNASGGYCALAFGNGPALSSLSPTTGAVGTNVPVTLTGSNLTGATLSVSGSGVTASNVVVQSATQITATLNIAVSAATGAYTITANTSAGASNGVTFTVTAGPPTLTSINPTTGFAGTNTAVTLTGTNFLAGSTINSSNPAITVSGLTVVSATQIKATFAISSTASSGTSTITVSGSNGVTSGVTFNIQPAFSTIRVNAGGAVFTDSLGQVWSADSGFTNGTPASNTNAVNGTPVPVLYQTAELGAGTPANLTYQATVPNGNYTLNLKFDEDTFSQAGQRVFNIVVNGQTVLTNFDIFAKAGARFQAVDVPISVSVSGGQLSVQFVPVAGVPRICALEVIAGTAAVPTLASFSPNSGTAGTNPSVTMTGTNLGSDLVVNAGPNIAVNNVVVNSVTQVTATFNIPSTAPSGAVPVTITTAGGSTPAAAFTVVGNGPSVTSISPNSGIAGTSVPVTLTGTNFAGGATVSVSGSGVTVTGVSVASTTQINATLIIAGTAAAGSRTVTVTTSVGTSNGAAFTVNLPAAPTTTGPPSPQQGNTGQSVNVTIPGTNFVAGATSIVFTSGTGVTASNVNVVNSATLTATFNIASNAPLGARQLVVTTPGGTSNSRVYVVFGTPVITGITPTSGAQGGAVTVTFSGNNISSDSVVQFSGTGITATNYKYAEGGSVTVTFNIAANAPAGPQNVTLTNSVGTSNAVTFTVNATGVGLTSVTPSSGTQGAAVPVTLTGTNFASGATVSLSGTGIGVSGVTVVSSTQITATFTIAANAPAGAQNVTVTSGGQTSNAATFTVNVAAPTLSSINPPSGTQGAAVPVTLTGTNFASGATVSLSGTGIGVSGVTVVSSTQITATFTIAANAPAGAQNVTVTSGGQTSNAVTFTVNVAAPTLSSINPPSGTQGAAVPVSLTGINFASGVTVSLSGTGIGVSGVTVVSSTQITATFTVAANAPAGAQNVTVTSGGQTSNAVTFTVNAAAPTLSSINPPSGTQGAAVPVTLTGTNFASGATVSLSGTGIGVSGVTVVSSTQITATFTIAANAPAGAQNVTVTSGGQTSNAVTFTVNTGGPNLSSISPSAGVIGTSVPVTLTGTNLSAGATIGVSGTGVTASAITVVSTTQITATLNIAGTAAAGGRTVTVTTPAGTSNAVTFTVNLPPAPTTTGPPSPQQGNLGQPVSVTIPGTNFVTGATSIVFTSGTGITVSNVNVVNSTTLTATFNIASNASLGARNLVVTTPGGTSNSRVYIVFGTPLITAISPNSGAHGGTVTVTFSGNNISSDSVVQFSGNGITATNYNFGEGSWVTVTFNIAANAPIGAQSVSLMNSVGTSNAVSFTVQ